MSNIAVFVFDELFESMVTSDQLSELKNLGIDLHIVSQKGNIGDYEPLKDSETRKIVCINPDFVDWDLSANSYKDIPGLQTIISSSDNISWLDASYANSHAINYVALENLTTEYAAVAEYAITIMMSLARTMPLLARNDYPLDYAHDFLKYQGIDIAGKTAGIIGLGNIGCAIANLCSGLGMEAMYWSRNEKPDIHVVYREIDDLLKEADVIFPTLKPNVETKSMLPNERLAQLKPDAIVVSVVSGLVDTNYLSKRVAEKELFGFGFGADPGTFSNYSGNVWAIPDYAWATQNNMRSSYDQFLGKIKEAIEALR